MSRYTTIRISLEDKKRLEKLAKLMGVESIAEALRRVLSIAEKEIDKYKGDLNIVLSSLKYAKNIGETDAREVDKYLYGGNS